MSSNQTMLALQQRIWQLESELRTLKEENSNLEEQITLMSDDIGRYIEDRNKQSNEIRRLEEANETLKATIEKNKAKQLIGTSNPFIV